MLRSSVRRLRGSFNAAAKFKTDGVVGPEMVEQDPIQGQEGSVQETLGVIAAKRNCVPGPTNLHLVFVTRCTSAPWPHAKTAFLHAKTYSGSRV